MKEPTFSICIPNYNYGRYIGETIQGVLDQTYQNFEIIVADNASTDNSVEVVQSFKDERIRLIRNRYNIGFAPNLQRATMFARNDFVNLLSSDDLMKPTALETYTDILVKQGDRAHHTVLMSEVEVINANGQIIGLVQRAPSSFDLLWLSPEAARNTLVNPDLPAYELHRGLDILQDTLKRLRTFLPFLTVVYPRVLWEAVEGYNSVRTIGPDKHFHYKLLAQDPDVIYVRAALFRYRVHGSLNQQAGLTTLKQQIDDYLYTIEFSDDFLESLGLSRGNLINALLDRVCLKTGLTQLVRGSYLHAFRMLAFSLAAYPVETLRRPRAYMLAGLLMLGPFSKPLAKSLYPLYRRLRPTPLATAEEALDQE